MIPRETQLTTNASRYLMIILPTSQKNNILYYFSTHKISFITIPRKKKQKFGLKLTVQDMWCQIFQDKYHKKKKRETKGMCLYLGACVAHSKAKIWFVSEILWFISLWDFDRVFTVFYVKDEQNKRLKLKKTKSQEYMMFISRYKAILNKKSNAASKISNIKPVEVIAKLLKLVII